MKAILLQFLRAVEAQVRHKPRLIGGIAGGIVVFALLLWWWIRSRRPSAAEVERRRREHLGTTGRITDGFILDTRMLSGEESVATTPEVLVYSYRLAGVTYNCAQDVSLLAEHVQGVKLDQPVQVRYDPRNPGNSVLVTETWTGLWEMKEAEARRDRTLRSEG